jgi:peptide-O-fucosyltransferase
LILCRYLLYEINPGEGFNLRRDVYIRIANLVKALNSDAGSWWTLVLPPWNRLYHWRTEMVQSQIPWSTFFDLDSFSLHVPVMEFVEFLNGLYQH